MPDRIKHNEWYEDAISDDHVSEFEAIQLAKIKVFSGDPFIRNVDKTKLKKRKWYDYVGDFGRDVGNEIGYWGGKAVDEVKYWTVDYITPRGAALIDGGVETIKGFYMPFDAYIQTGAGWALNKMGYLDEQSYMYFQNLVYDQAVQVRDATIESLENMTNLDVRENTITKPIVYNITHFPQYFDPDTSYSELKEYSTNLYQSALTMYGAKKVYNGVQSIGKSINFKGGLMSTGTGEFAYAYSVTADGALALSGTDSVAIGVTSFMSSNSKGMRKTGYKTTKEATEAAEALGFKKISETSHGQAVYKKGKRYITMDVDSHNGGVWKMADSVKNLGSKKNRMGTYDADLNWIGE